MPKKRPRVTRFNTHNEDAYTQWKQDFALAVMQQGPVHPLTGPLLLSVEVEFRLHPASDVDNLAGAVMDALNGVCYEDDKQIVDLHVSKLHGQKRDCVTVDIAQLLSSASE
jgi:Holliday junction resolvase RusA-like endonuclease